MDGKIRESKSRSPAFPYRVIHGKRKYSEWPVDARILLLCPIRRGQEPDGCDGANRGIRTHNRAVVENEIIGQRVNIAKADEKNREYEGTSRINHRRYFFHTYILPSGAARRAPLIRDLR